VCGQALLQPEEERIFWALKCSVFSELKKLLLFQVDFSNESLNYSQVENQKALESVKVGLACL